MPIKNSGGPLPCIVFSRGALRSITTLGKHSAAEAGINT
jgi:hypothetical protein